MPTLYCPSCGYNLTGLRDERCPECGEPFSREELRRYAEQAVAMPSLIWPLLSLLIAPVLLFLGMVLMSYRIGSPALLQFGMVALPCLTLATSIYMGVITARRSATSPSVPTPTAGLIVLSILFSFIFLFAELGLMAVAFIAGCAMQL